MGKPCGNDRSASNSQKEMVTTLASQGHSTELGGHAVLPANTGLLNAIRPLTTFCLTFFHPPPNKYDQKPLWHHIKRSHLAIFWQHNTTELSPAEATARECWENCSQKKRPPSKTEIVYCGSIALKRLHRSVPMFETHKPFRTKIYAFHPRGNSGEIMGKGFQTFFKKE